MAESHENSSRNTAWERTVLIEQLRELFEGQIGKAAILTNEQNDVLACLRGVVEPYNDGFKTHYQNLGVFLIGRWTMDGEQRAALHFGSTMGNTPRCLSLNDNLEVLQKLTLPTTVNDPRHSFLLRRSIFDSDSSAQLAAGLFNSGAVKSNWHTLLGVTLDSSPPSVAPEVED